VLVLVFVLVFVLVLGQRGACIGPGGQRGGSAKRSPLHEIRNPAHRKSDTNTSTRRARTRTRWPFGQAYPMIMPSLSPPPPVAKRSRRHFPKNGWVSFPSRWSA
jgi:hypothetical protein